MAQNGSDGHCKDAILDRLAEDANVAQFVSFGPDLAQRFAWIHGYPPNHRFGAPREAVAAILAASPEGTVNIRSYEPDNPKSREFLYGKSNIEEVLRELGRLAGEGLFTLVNETIDIGDGGVSGVAFGEVLEFAPGDTPRCVEKPGTAALPRRLGLELLETVYHFRPELPPRPELRVEFSLHPLRRGYRRRHTVLWETEEPGLPPEEAEIAWPNRFSRLLGDKAFGLLIADALGLRVPRTLVVPRGLPPFSFGSDTGLAETWIRTCPVEQMPGLYTTQHGWLDPFRLLQKEDPTGQGIASVLAQQAVEARYSGALIGQPAGQGPGASNQTGAPLIEGVAGQGDEFMVGRQAPESLPRQLVDALLEVYRQASARLGPVRFEWVYDGAAVWVVQLHKGSNVSTRRTVYPGEAPGYRPFRVGDGIEALRALIAEVQGSGEGIALIGRVGVTSHVGDLLRRARIPSRIVEPPLL
ncbi:MAG TPA: hypothetical protein VHQ90_16225 [Thermoanaerobaculia bacterium]|nr:hypothetical protein [Thermoanaerobaculia bacterium]